MVHWPTKRFKYSWLLVFQQFPIKTAVDIQIKGIRYVA